MKQWIFRWLCIVPWLLCLQLAVNAHAAEERPGGTPTLVITYHVAPANRPAFRDELESTVLHQFQSLQEAGVLKNYRILYSRYADSDNWDAMAFLTFPSTAELLRWKTIERTLPAGLTPKALALTTAIHSTPGAVLRSKRATEPASSPVFLVIPYLSLVSAGDYLKYADGYAIPQFDGAMVDGIMSEYQLFAGNFPASRPWSAMIVLTYRDEAALARRNAVEAKVRSRLAEVPQWQSYSDSKKGIREERQVVIADPISVR